MIFLGLDLGQRQDPSALAIVERVPRVTQRMNHVTWQVSQETEPAPMVVRHLERMPLGTEYGDVVKRVEQAVERPVMKGKKTLAVDATGVGMPVVEMLLRQRMGCEVRPVMFTAGMGQSTDGRLWFVGKVDLMAGLRQALETGEMLIPKQVVDGVQLLKELMSVTVGMRPSGLARVGADGFGEHDDLVIALALACWAGMGSKPREPVGRLFW